MAIDETHYKGWRIEVLHGGLGWKVLVYRPGATTLAATFPNYPNRREAIEEAKMFIDEWSRNPQDLPQP